MTKFFAVSLLCVAMVASSWKYQGSTTAAVCLTGGILMAEQDEGIKVKVPRSKCPECKGTGKVPTGDWNNPFIPCDDCYDDAKETKEEPKTTEPPPVATEPIKKKICPNPYCPCEDCDCVDCGCVPMLEK